MAALEEELRGSLSRQAGEVPPGHDLTQLADLVIRRAGLVRRRQRWAGVGVSMVFALLAGLGLSIYLPEQQPPPVSTLAVRSSKPEQTQLDQLPSTLRADSPKSLYSEEQSVFRLPVDLVADDRLVTADGASIDVSFAGEVSQAYRVAEGWLVVGVPESATRASVWLVKTSGDKRVLLSGVAGVAFDPVAHRVAWRVGPRVFLSTVTGGRISGQPRSRSVGNLATPVGFVADAVLLARGGTGGYDLWWPEHGIYQEAWQSATAVYGDTAGGRAAVGQVAVDPAVIEGGQVAGERRCLALFDVDVRSATRLGGTQTRSLPQPSARTVCKLGLSPRSPGWVSPGGRWLLTGAGGRTVLVDLSRLGTEPQVLSQGPPLPGGVAWLDEQTVVIAIKSGKAVVRLRVDGELRDTATERVEQWAIPVAAKEAVLLVPAFKP